MTTRSTQPHALPATPRTAALALAADVGCILLFCAVGRRNHAEGLTAAGVAQTAWPFLAGLTVAWLLSRAWRQPAALRQTGVTVWLGTVALGIGIRAVTGAGIAPSFIVVATLVTGALLLGWRAVVAAAGRRRTGQDSPSGVS